MYLIETFVSKRNDKISKYWGNYWCHVVVGQLLSNMNTIVCTFCISIGTQCCRLAYRHLTCVVNDAMFLYVLFLTEQHVGI